MFSFNFVYVTFYKDINFCCRGHFWQLTGLHSIIVETSTDKQLNGSEMLYYL